MLFLCDHVFVLIGFRWHFVDGGEGLKVLVNMMPSGPELSGVNKNIMSKAERDDNEVLQRRLICRSQTNKQECYRRELKSFSKCELESDNVKKSGQGAIICEARRY